MKHSSIEVAMIDVGNRLWKREYISGTSGNFSTRLDDTQILATPTGLAKGRLTREDLVVTDLEGTVLSGQLRPSTELKIHLTTYRLRPDVGAIVHAHPKTVVAYSLAGVKLMSTVLPETVAVLGEISLVPYETPGTAALASKMENSLANHNAIVMERHGAITLGRDLAEAYNRMEILEHTAQTLYLAHTLGRVEALSKDEIERLREH